MNWHELGLILAGLFIFGLFYNQLVEVSERRGWIEGYTSLYVVIGVGVTIAATGFVIGWTNVLYITAAFVASGLPMIVGSITRYIRARETAQKCLINQDPGQT